MAVTDKTLLRRLRSLKLDKAEAVQRIEADYDDDIRDRSAWADRRNQRYAKFRGWLEPKNYPWPGSANSHMSVIATDVLRTEDTLHNAVLSIRPVMGAVALNQVDELKSEPIDDLLDYQIFIENRGEELIGELISAFVQDGTCVSFIPYIKETRVVSSVHTLGQYDQTTDFQAFALDKLREVFGRDSLPKPVDSAQPFRWTARVEQPTTKELEEIEIELYVDEEDEVQCVSKQSLRIFDGPCLIPKDLEDILVPTRSANLQPRSLSNPKGAAHVMVLDVTTLDEVKRLQQEGYYDLLTKEEIKGLEESKTHGTEETGSDPHTAKVLKDDLTGVYHGHSADAAKRLTRITWYGQMDVDGDGLDEEVILWYLKDSKKLLRAKYLTEMYPANPPRRPFAEARFIAVPGQFYGIGLIELLEHLYDLLKATFDQMIDSGTLANDPWGFYRAASGLTPGVIRMMPGELYPMTNPKEDVAFPNLPHADQSFRINVVGILSQFLDELSMIGQLQLGRVPHGKASALRTASTTQTLLQQGDARPEHLLRRFFRGLAEVWTQFHELNRAFLPKGKQFKIINAFERGKDPYVTVDDLSTLKGRFEFDFQANILNTNKALKGQIMNSIAGLLINGMTLQMGLVTPEKIYLILRDILKASGQDTNYLQKPTPDIDAQKITWQEAVLLITHGRLPDGYPAEGASRHLQYLMEFHNSINFGYLTEGQATLFAKWLQRIQGMAMQEAQAASMADQFAASMGGGMGPTQPGPAAPQGPAGNAPVNAGELQDESLMNAGGGANAAAPGMM